MLEPERNSARPGAENAPANIPELLALFPTLSAELNLDALANINGIESFSTTFSPEITPIWTQNLNAALQVGQNPLVKNHVIGMFLGEQVARYLDSTYAQVQFSNSANAFLEQYREVIGWVQDNPHHQFSIGFMKRHNVVENAANLGVTSMSRSSRIQYLRGVEIPDEDLALEEMVTLMTHPPKKGKRIIGAKFHSTSHPEETLLELYADLKSSDQPLYTRIKQLKLKKFFDALTAVPPKKSVKVLETYTEDSRALLGQLASLELGAEGTVGADEFFLALGSHRLLKGKSTPGGQGVSLYMLALAIQRPNRWLSIGFMSNPNVLSVQAALTLNRLYDKPECAWRDSHVGRAFKSRMRALPEEEKQLIRDLAKGRGGGKFDVPYFALIEGS